MEPRIQYTRTADGISIAYLTMGEGRPFVTVAPPHAASIGMVELPDARRIFQASTENRMVVYYDHRGTGFSERDVIDCLLDGFLLDLEAVVDRLGKQAVDLLASGALSGAIAITFAARHPGRVSRLVLRECAARVADVWDRPQAQVVLKLYETDWESATEAIAYTIQGFADADSARGMAKMMRENISQERAIAVLRASMGWDVAGLLPRVLAPTLVVHQRDYRLLDIDTARKLASTIPNARLVIMEGGGLVPLQHWEEWTAVVEEFLSEEEASPQTKPAAGGFRTILFTDIEGSTALTQRLGDAKARELLRDHERITREVLAAHGGTEVKTMGDGFMASFGSVTKAVECAIALQRAFAEREGEPLSIRVGLNAGEPIEEDGDLFGATVILASRIAAKAEGGEILVADTVRGLCSGKGFLFADRGEFVAKGFEEPVRVYEVRWRDA